MPQLKTVTYQTSIISGQVTVTDSEGHTFQFGTPEDMQSTADSVYQRLEDVSREIQALNYLDGVLIQTPWTKTEATFSSASAAPIQFANPA